MKASDVDTSRRNQCKRPPFLLALELSSMLASSAQSSSASSFSLSSSYQLRLNNHLAKIGIVPTPLTIYDATPKIESSVTTKRTTRDLRIVTTSHSLENEKEEDLVCCERPTLKGFNDEKRVSFNIDICPLDTHAEQILE